MSETKPKYRLIINELGFMIWKTPPPDKGIILVDKAYADALAAELEKEKNRKCDCRQPHVRYCGAYNFCPYCGGRIEVSPDGEGKEA